MSLAMSMGNAWQKLTGVDYSQLFFITGLSITGNYYLSAIYLSSTYLRLMDSIQLFTSP
jgi:hypothetical protein